MALGNPLPTPAFTLHVADVLPAAAPIASPQGVGALGSGAGGTLAAGTYRYVITATNASGETIASAEVSVVLAGATSSVTLSWGAVPGATGYRVYRSPVNGASGSENVYYVVAGGSIVSYVDTNAASTGGAPPAATWQVVSLINSWDGDYNEAVSEFPVFQLADPLEVNGVPKSSVNFGGYLADSTDSGQALVKAHQTAKDFLLVRVLWDGVNGFLARARCSTKKLSAKSGANLAEVMYTFNVAPGSITIVGAGPAL